MVEYAIGLTAAGLTNLEALGVPIPQATAVDYAEYVENGEGDLVGQGWLMCRWRFTGVTPAQMATLEAYLGACYIRTLRHDGTYATYSARMAATPRQAPKVDLLFDYVIEFRKLVAI